MSTPTDTQKPKHIRNAFNVLIASRSAGAINILEENLSAMSSLQIHRNHICNGHSDPLHGFTERIDLLIFWVGENWVVELEELMSRPSSDRPPLIICANNDDPLLMRTAMKAGACDYLRAPVIKDELIASVTQQIDDAIRKSHVDNGAITAVINAKGGSGSSFIACNIADLMTESSNLDVALMGLDIQFGSLSGYLDINAQYGLMEALQNIEGMDREALNGYMTKHPTGLNLLDLKPGDLFMPEDVNIDSLSKLLDLLCENYDQVVIDLPRQIDFLTSTVIDRSDKLLIVMQQSIAHLHDAKRLIDIFRRDLSVPNEKIMVVVNRYDKDSDLTLASIAKTLQHKNLLTVPNAFEQVNESINGGEPLYNVFRKSAITKSLMQMKDTLIETDAPHEVSGLRKVFNRFGMFRS